ncbi:putative mechanosensitive ion channel protein [Ordospora pajunii]|uniref:putative mechanosensitive ion channel protein n=1 Tax=Ordospora pajunii TaxID=3039483 RepID=UPI002952621F|nr:putative mechanosensitive ion channel protein [Ordospora pajunii]KAH9412213.1 putative mechanosensitive ion channel protein [Ordospora pajunii]
MDGVIKSSARIDLEDSDSHNYTHESDTSTEDGGNDYGYGNEGMAEASSSFERLKNSAAGTLQQRSGWIFLGGVALLLVAFCTWKIEVSMKARKGDVIMVSLSNFLFLCSGSVFLFIALNFLIFKISFAGLKRSNSLNTFFYYTNEISEHISAGIIFITGIVVVFLRDKDYCMNNAQGLDLFFGDLFNCFLVATVMLGGVRVFHRAISMNFNYSVYIRRIRRVLLEDAFISLLAGMDGKQRRPAKPRIGVSGEMVCKSDAISSINEYLEDLYECNEHVDDLGLPRKRVILKEFQRLMRRSSVSRGNMMQVSQRLRSRANSKANRMVGRDGRLGPMSELSLYFQKPEIFRFLMKEIGVDEDYRFSRGSLTEFIEKSYRERHILRENLEHMNSAVDKVSFAFKLMIGVLVMAMLYIKAGGEGITTIGVISAFFGTHFISNSFSSSVISSIIFLFFIHPYDIGDRVFITMDNAEENLVVSELNVFSTVFYRWDGTYITILNTVLAQKAIRNLRRSGIMAESHKIQINSRTNQKKLVRLKELIDDFVKSHPEDYTEYTMLNHECIEDSSKLHMKVYMQYKSSWQNFELYLKRKTKFLSFLNRAMQGLEIEYMLPTRTISLKNV